MMPVPRYLPHSGHTWWGKTGSWQWGQIVTFGIATRSCERRDPRLDFDLFFFGTAIVLIQSP